MRIIEVLATGRSRVVNCADDLVEELDLWLVKPTRSVWFSINKEGDNCVIMRDGKYVVYTRNTVIDLYSRAEMSGVELIEHIVSVSKYRNTTHVNYFWYFLADEYANRMSGE